MKKHYNNLDWLRLIFALSVVFYHCWNATGDKIKGLYYAVPAFLAVSGFLVLKSYEESTGAAHFFWKRLLRVGPAFVASFVLCGAIFGLESIWPTFRTWYTVGLAPDPGTRNGVLWTLTVEEVLYITLAVAYAAGAYKKPRLLWAALVASIALPIAMTLALTADVWINEASRARGVSALPSAFIIGNLFYMYRESIKGGWWTVAAVIACAALYSIRGESYIGQFLVQTVFIASLVWFGISGPKITQRVRVDLSYGAYLYHLLILQWIMPLERWSLIGATFAITIAISLISAFAIERPALTMKNNPWQLPRKAQPVAAKVAAVLVCFCMMGISDAKRIRLLIVGDSISKRQLVKSYGATLPEALGKAGIDYQLVGVGENSTAFGGFASLHLGELIRSTPPTSADVVLLQAGTIDMSALKDGRKYFSENFDRLLALVREKNQNAVVLVAPIPPLRKEPMTMANRTIRRQVEARNDKRMFYIGDFGAKDWSASRFDSDFVHPSLTGRRFLSQRWVRALKKFAA